MVKIHGLDAGQPKPMRSTFLPAFRNNVSCAIVTAGIWIPYGKKCNITSLIYSFINYINDKGTDNSNTNNILFLDKLHNGLCNQIFCCLSGTR